MVLQPLVENALRHGIAPSETGGTVRVQVTTADDRLHVEVSDTGVGPDADEPLAADPDGMGLANTSARLERTYGPEAALHTAPNDPSGFVVWFSLPRNGPAE
jgi:sensor histidine kinase YesM